MRSHSRNVMLAGCSPSSLACHSPAKPKPEAQEYDFCGGHGLPEWLYQWGRTTRLRYIYEIDRTLPIGLAHEYPLIQKLYDEYLGEYGSHTAHELLYINPVKRWIILISVIVRVEAKVLQ